jgi:hypothetical protein
MAERHRARALRRPDPAPHRLQAEPVFVGRPELDREDVLRALLGDDLAELLWNGPPLRRHRCSVTG